MHAVTTLCLFVLLLSLIHLNESKSFIPQQSRLSKTSTKKSSNKASSSSRLSRPNIEKILKLRGGGFEKLDWRFFVAGSISAAFSHGITTPIDVVKTKMQTNPERFNKGVVHAAGDIISKEGVGFLLAGLGPTVVGYGLEGALKFGFYETFKKIFDHAKVTPYTALNFMLASVVAGAIASIVLCPMEEARIKMVGEPSWAKENVVTAIIRLVRESGFFATFGGLPAMLSKQVPYTMGKNVSFDLIKTLLAAFATYLAINEKDLKWIITLAGAFFSSIVACLLSQPGDMILTSSYKGESGKSFSQTISEIYKNHGLTGFYFGTQARLAHVASIVTIQLVFYDFICGVLGLAPSH